MSGRSHDRQGRDGTLRGAAMFVVVAVVASGVGAVAAAPAASAAPLPPVAIAPLGPVDPGPDETVAVERAPFAPAPPVVPSPAPLPLRHGQELVDAAAAESLATLDRAGFLGADGTQAIDATALQPQAGPAPPAGPRPRHRVCSESASLAVSCTGPLALAMPVSIDVTGDQTDDVRVQLRPAQGGVRLTVTRLGSSETTGGPLAAHVWAVQDTSDGLRLSMGFDGFRRGTSLPQSTSAIFTFDSQAAATGRFDLEASVSQSGAGDALAVTMGAASVAPTGAATDPTVASARFSPVPNEFESHAVVGPTEDDGTVAATADARTLADMIVIANRATQGAPTDRFTQLVVDQLQGSVTAGLAPEPGGGPATVDYSATSVNDRVVFADYGYAGDDLTRAVSATTQGTPLEFATAMAAPTDGVTLGYQAAGPMAAFDVGIFDRSRALIATAGLREVPTAVTMLTDASNDQVRFTSDDKLGSGSVVLSRAFGSIPALDGDHVAMVVAGPAMGAVARVTGLRSVDAFFGPHPRLAATFEPGGQPFTAAAVLESTEKARIEISNVPSDVRVDVDPTARTFAYQASSVAHRVRATSVDTAGGPSLVFAVDEAPTSVGIGYELGDRPHVDYTASSAAPRVEFFAGPQGVETLDPNTHHYLSVAATGVPTDVDLLVDFPARHLRGTTSAPLGGLVAVARFPIGGRAFVAAAEITGAPGGFDADFADGLLRFRGLGGPLTSARLLVTNHADSVAVPTGQHLAVHYREVTGEFDGGILVRGLSTAEYTRAATGHTFRVDADAGGEPVVVDADVVLAAGGVDDTRLAAVGRLANVPAALTVELAGGVLTYRADRPVGVRIEARIGKVAALTGIGAPLFDHGVAAHAAGCGAGPGCATDTSDVCTSFGRCFGVVGTVHLPVLRTAVSVDLADRTVTIGGAVTGPLRVYVRLDGLISQIGRLRALATLTGLPSSLDITIGPFGIDSGDPSRVRVESVSTSGGFGAIQVDADADTTTAFGDVRGRMTTVNAPAVLNATGQFGSVSRIDVAGSSPMSELSAQMTALLSGGPRSGRVSFTDVPAAVDFDVTGFGPATLGVPTIVYDGHGFSTLDGLAQVEAGLVEAFSLGGVTFPHAGDVSVRFTNLGTATTVRTVPDTSVFMSSVPDTDALDLGARLASSVPNRDVDIEVFDENGFTGTLSGHVGAPTIHIGRLALSVVGLRSLALRPGEAAFLTMGIEGSYDLLGIDVADVFIDPDVDLVLDVDGPGPMDFSVHTLIQDPMTGVRFHLADQVLRESGCVEADVFGVGNAHVRIFTKPGPIARQVNTIDVFGANGPQALNYIDPIPFPSGEDPAAVSMFIDLLTVYVTRPLPAPDADYDPDFGGC